MFRLVAGLTLTAVLLLVWIAVGVLDPWRARASLGLDDPNKITVLGNASSLYTIPDNRDFLVTGFCADDKSMYLTMGGSKVLVDEVSRCGASMDEFLIHGGEILGCEGSSGSCSFSGVLVAH